MLLLPVRGQPVLFLCVLAASALAVFAFVDLSPHVDRNFFFSSDDSQVQEDERIREFFPDRPQIMIAASGDIHSADYGQRVAKLSADLVKIEGLLNVRDIHHGPEDIDDAFENELCRRLLVAEDGHSTNLVLTLETEDHETVIAAVEEVLDRHRDEGFELAVSGVSRSSSFSFITARSTRARTASTLTRRPAARPVSWSLDPEGRGEKARRRSGRPDAHPGGSCRKGHYAGPGERLGATAPVKGCSWIPGLGRRL